MKTVLIGFLWFTGAVIVAMLADRRNRSPILWFLSAVILSPPVAFILVLIAGQHGGHARAILRVESNGDIIRRRGVFGLHTTSPGRGAALAEPFRPDGVYAGVPFRAIHDTEIEALLPGGTVRCASIAELDAIIKQGSAGKQPFKPATPAR